MHLLKSQMEAEAPEASGDTSDSFHSCLTKLTHVTAAVHQGK